MKAHQAYRGDSGRERHDMNRDRWTRLACWMLVGTAIACGERRQPRDGGDATVTEAGDEDGRPENGMDASSDVEPDGALESSTDAGTDTRSDAWVLPPRGGLVGASVYDFPGLGPQSVGVAGFYELTGTNPTGSCRQRFDGPCIVVDCRNTSGADAGTSDGGARRVHAGTITIAGGSMPTPIALTPDTNGNYRPVSERGARWRAGDMLAFQAAGAEVPGFMATLVFPTPVTVTRPTVSSPLERVPIDRSAGFVAEWERGAGEVTVTIARAGERDNAINAVTNGVVVQCVYPSADGRGIVPPSAMAELTPSMSVLDAYVAITARASTRVVAGDYDVTVYATGGGLLAAAEIR